MLDRCVECSRLDEYLNELYVLPIKGYFLVNAGVVVTNAPTHETTHSYDKAERVMARLRVERQLMVVLKP